MADQPNGTNISSWLGIDLGTTNTAVAIMRDGKVEVLYNSDSNASTVTKSCVYFEQNTNKTIVGNMAVCQKISKPANTIYEAKRVIGVPYHNELGRVREQVARFKEHAPFKVISWNGYTCFEVPHAGQTLPQRPQDIGAKILAKMRTMAEERVNGRATGERVQFRRAVITVPAGFSIEQKKATIEAGQLAGLEEVHLITEPAAAAYAYGFQQRRVDGYKVLVFDFGGGTFDVSIVDVRNGEFHVFGHRRRPLVGRQICGQSIRPPMEVDAVLQGPPLVSVASVRPRGKEGACGKC